MRKLINFFLIGSWLLAPKCSWYVLASGLLASLSVNMNGQHGIIEGGGIVWVAGLLLITAVVSLVLTVIKVLKE